MPQQKNLVTKAQVIAFIKSRNHTAAYSGRSRTMYIKGSEPDKVELQILKTFKDMASTTASVREVTNV